ncbi:uncharacterized protein LOC113521939 [Galleria mellonella]|uniref:Uncharacterized protein LOC113521939 n=1 Tax=Galleria mellonella TaxID=7137 RepID=A0A6J1X8A3_GALME|nr:uncharacterized protein LOC113521939 [Galleria mellonella]
MFIHKIVIILTTSVFIVYGEVPEVVTTHGKVQGKVLTTLIENVQYLGFMGIPYAAPPVNNLRFLPPQAIDPWDEVLVAKKEKRPCIQYNINVKKGQPLGHYGVEDCLYLDIFTPKLDKKKRAVIVFLHNEYFTCSYNKTKDYAPDFFIEEDIIIVTISHRLSVLGFLSFEDDTLPGNAGLKDIVEALKWIEKNIDRFGGNPEKITLMGSHGGAAAVDLLIHSNAKDLFHSAIMQSGTALSTAYLQSEVKARAFKLGEILKLSTSSSQKLLEYLRSVPAEDLLHRNVHASPKDYYRDNQRGVLSFGPIVETQKGGLITEYPENCFTTIQIPIMIGFNSREGLDMSLQYLIEPKYLSFVEKDFPFIMPKRVNFKFDPVQEEYYNAIDDIKRFYFPNKKVKINNIPEYLSYIGDVLAAYPIDSTVNMYANKSSNSIYYYYFDYYSELNENKNNLMKLSTVEDGTWGAATGDELCYLFKCPSLKKQYLKYNKSLSNEINIQRKMVTMWSNFAKYGDPTPEGDILLENLKWPSYDMHTKTYLHINEKIELKTELYKEKFNFWKQFINTWEKRAVNGIVSGTKNKKDEPQTFSIKTYLFKMIGALFTVFLFCITSLNICYGDVIVETNSGKINGVEVKSIIENEKYYSFMGIPYAEPPIGDLRFMPPIPHSGWSDILPAKKEKKPCAQNRVPIRGTKKFGYCGDEDCLHLSIHTPKLPNEGDLNLPVIVFIHNEHYRMSSNNSIDYGPDFFMSENVVLVMVNHRLGVFGFLSFADELLPGNNGLRDVILALKWIKINIEKFGGDPNKVTLMGSDGGAVLVDILLHSPKAKGLYNAAILQSGNLWNSMSIVNKTRERAIDYAKELKEEVTSSSYLLKRLHTKSPIDLTLAEETSVHADDSRAVQVGILPFGPIIEHEHPDAIFTKIPETPFDMNVPVMIGYNSREGIEVTERYLHKPQYLTFADRDFLVLLPIRTNFHFDIHSSAYANAIEEIKNFYFEEGYIKINKPGEFVTYIGDIMSFYPINYGVRKYVNESSYPVYYYMFDYSGEFNKRKKNVLSKSKTIDGTWGATMGDDLCYLFVCKSIKKSYKKAIQDDDSEDMKIVKNMVKMWSNFARTGNPTPPGDQFIWKPASKDKKECLVINEELQIKNNLHQETVDFWDNFIEKYREKAIDGVVKDIKDEL